MQDPFSEFLGQVSLFCKILEDFSVAVDEIALGANTGNKRAQTADIVRECDAADNLYDDHPDCLVIGGWNDVPETDSQHDGCCPVV